MHVLVLRLALSHLKQKPFSRIVVVGSVACILLINALVFLFFSSLSKSLAEIRATKFVTAHLESSVQPSREAEVLSAVKKIPGVSSAQLVSRDTFVANFSKYFPQLSNELSTLDPETIPRYLKVKVDAARSTNVEQRLKSVKGVESVEPNKNRYNGLIGALATLRKLALVLIGGMSMALLCILLNHFKLGSAFQAQVRNTLTILGARPGLVVMPFILEGLIEGAAGGLLAAGLLLGYGGLFESQMNQLFAAIGYHPYHFELIGLAIGLAALGTVSGMIGSLWAALHVAR